MKITRAQLDMIRRLVSDQRTEMLHRHWGASGAKEKMFYLDWANRYDTLEQVLQTGGTTVEVLDDEADEEEHPR